jgi:L-fucose dehydrogenase
MDLGLRDHVVCITGGGSGIGEAITRLCVEEGARPVIVSRSTPAVEALLRDLQQAGHVIDFFEAELGEPSSCAAAIQFIQQRYGRLDGLVNNAGFNDGIGLANGNPTRFMNSLRDNLLHYYAMAHYALPMLTVSRGSIVNISSKVALTGQGGTSAYAAAKGAQLALTREWAAELAAAGVRVNCVLPAEVMTPLYEAWLAGLENPEETVAAISWRIPLGHRMTTPREIASTVVFLLSSSHSGHTTGQQIVVDGGYTHLDRALTSR